MPGRGPAPALLVAPKREPPWAVLRMAGAPEILGLTAWAGGGALSDILAALTGTAGP